MASFNRVVIMGNLGQDPELRYTQSQTPVCTLNVATTDYRNGPDGQRQEFTDWHRVVVWSKQAENCAKYLSKGRSVLVEGRLQTRSWEDKQGQKRYITEIVANTVQFVGGPREGRSERHPGHEGVAGAVAGGAAASFGHDAAPESSGFGGPETPSLDDIPF